MSRRRSAPARSSITRRRGTIAGRTAMSPPTKFPIRIAPSYVSELRARVEAIGASAVARAAGIDRRTIWRQLAGGEGRQPTPSTIEQIRRAVAKLDPKGDPLPPALVAVRGRVHHEWLALADDIDPSDLSRVIVDAAKRYTRRK